MKKKALISAILTIALCLSIISGSTFALFTSESKVNVAVTAGNVEVVATAENFKLDSTLGENLKETSATFSESDNTVCLEKIVPGDVVSFDLRVKNNSDVTIKYRTVLTKVTDNGLWDGLVVTIGGVEYDGATKESAWAKAAPDSEDIIVPVVVTLPQDAGNEYKLTSCSFAYTVEAVQGNASVETWDGTADTSWYNDTDTEFTLTTAEQFAGLAVLTGTTDQFEGKTIKLDGNINLALEDGAKSAFGSSFAPIGSTGERDSRNRLVTQPFKGTLDGNGHTISNLYQSGWDFGYEWGQYGSIGLFSELEGATVKNVVIEGFECQVEGGDVAFIAGSATGDCVFENIEIKSGSIGTYNNGIGSIIGWSGAGSYTFKDVTIGEDVVIGGLWGSFDSSVGGVVGQGEKGATYNFENVDVACRLDVYNDVTAAYKYYLYRMSGMLIGRLEETATIDGSNYPDMSKYNITCKDVTVTYGDWMNYHYCVVEGKTAWRHEPGYAYGGIPADHDHSTCAMHCNVCLPFEGLFGGDQYGVRPITEYDGVKVVYPDSYTPEN